MRSRFHMQNASLMVEHYDYKELVAIRKADQRFKRRRIKSVLQAYPDQVAVGVVYIIGSNPPKPAPTCKGAQTNVKSIEG